MKRITLIAVFVILTIAACRPISRGPNPYQAPSPLAMSMESPLYARGANVIPDLPGGLVAPDEVKSAAGTIPTALRYRLQFPIMAHQSKRQPCGAVWMAAELMRLMITDRVQQRKSPRCNDLVTMIAQMRADDMVKTERFSHTDANGHGANFYLAQVGCLPAWYPQDGNSVESITLNYHTPQASWNALVSSRGHRPHVLGMHPFFASQVAIGVGYAESGWGKVYVVVTTEGCR
jgi:hypothetical protein